MSAHPPGGRSSVPRRACRHRSWKGHDDDHARRHRSPPDRPDDRHHHPLSRSPRPRRRRLPPSRRRDPLAHGRERRRQVHPDQGAHRRVPDRQRIRSTSRGEPRVFGSTADAQSAGISTVYQEVNLCANLSVGENVMLGHEPRCGGRHRLEGRASRGGTPPREPRPARRHALHAVEPFHRDPAARRHQPRHGARREGAHPRRADIEPRPRRGRAAVRRHARPPRPRRRDPVRQPLPRSGLRGLGPHHDPAQRPAHRRVRRRRTLPRGARHQDDRPRARRARRHLVDDRAVDRPHAEPPCCAPPASDAAACSSRPTSTSTKARSSASPACSARDAPSSCACCTAQTARTPGTIEVERPPVRMTSPRVAIDKRMVFSSEDRRAEGVIGDLTVAQNIVLGIQARRGWMRRVRRSEQDAVVAEYIKALDVRPADPNLPAAQSLRRQPAEGAARPLARHGARAHRARRAHTRHRRRREGRHPAQGRRALGARVCRSSSSHPSSKKYSGSHNALS